MATLGTGQLNIDNLPFSAEDLLIIYEAEAEQWASYLHFHLVGPIPEAGICCYDIALVTSRRDDFLRLGGYKCKLLILSRGMLEGLCQLRRFFLARVLRPETSVVILLCGVESLDPLLELVPLKGDQCLQISSEQEPQDYQLAAGAGEPMSQGDTEDLEGQGGADGSGDRGRVGDPEGRGGIFILLQEAIASKDAEVEFSGNKQRVRVKPVNWNESTLKVTAPDFTAGHVIVTLYSKGLVKGNACLQYYTIMEDIAHFLQQAADPVKFMCQVSTCLRNLFFPFPECHSEDIPTLLHFAAQHGLRDLASALLQCPGSRQALKIPNSHGHTPLDLAHVHGHNQLLHPFSSSSVLCRSGSTVAFWIYASASVAGAICSALALRILPVALAHRLSVSASAPLPTAPPPLVGPLESAAIPPPWLLPPSAPPWAAIMAVAWFLLGPSCSKSFMSPPWVLPPSSPSWTLSAGPLPGVRPPPEPPPNPSLFTSKCWCFGNQHPFALYTDNLWLVDPNEEHQNNEGENVYTPLGRDGEEYDTILTSSSSVVIVNRPPAPTPRPDSLPTPEDKTPFIAQVFQKKKSQGDAETLPRDSISTTYDTFVPSQPPGLDELIKLQQEVKMGSLSIDDALDRFNDWQRLQKGMDSIQQVMDMVNPLEFL
uniref:DBB domain-containing protein n=1 Tax=Sinocyclocheilus rhinocerous TaxID=307959 RepID=A0A673N2S3_9TELE